MNFAWKKEYETGIAQIDQQHQKLFQLAEEIYTLLKDEFYIDKFDKIMALVEELKDYAVFHFQTEESYMRSINYPKYFSHKVEHDDFIDKINNIDVHAIDQDQDAYLLDLLDFIVDWISNHILKMDKMISAK